MTFDINKAAEVEGMTEAEFGVWKSSKYNEISAHSNGGTSLPGRTMLTLTVEEHTETANTLRTVAAVDTSNRAMSLSRQKKTEILKQLRGQFECSRKLFNFALVNAGEKEFRVYYAILMNFLLQTKVCQQQPR